jgi:putative membrane protein
LSVLSRDWWMSVHAASALSIPPFTLMGVALAIFLGFRNSVSYDRYWEARKQWGALITVARTLSRQTVMLEGRQDVADPVTRRRITDLVIAFCHALVSHLRLANATVATDLIPEDLSQTYARSRNRPDMLLREISGASMIALGAGLALAKRQ